MRSQYVVFGSGGDFLWQLQILAGVFLILAGILIAVFPQILVAMISGMIILCGVALIVAGWRTRRLLRYHRRDEVEVIDP